MTGFSDDRAVPAPIPGSGGPLARVAELTSSQLPLESGLRALATEIPYRRPRRQLLHVADRLAAGIPLQRVITEDHPGVSRYLQDLIRIGVTRGVLGSVLEQYLRIVRRDRFLWTRAYAAICYPLCLAMLTIGVMVWITSFIVPQFASVFSDFGVELPEMTSLLLKVSQFIAPIGIPLIGLLAAMMLTLLLLAALMPTVSGPLGRLLQRLPIVGGIARYSGNAKFCALLALLVEHDLPLPEALRGTASACSDRNLRAGGERLALAIEDGEDPLEAANRLPHFLPATAGQFRWSDRRDAFAASLRAASEMFASQAQVREAVLGLFVQPLIVVAAACIIGLVLISLFMPLIKLLNELS